MLTKYNLKLLLKFQNFYKNLKNGDKRKEKAINIDNFGYLLLIAQNRLKLVLRFP